MSSFLKFNLIKQFLNFFLIALMKNCQTYIEYRQYSGVICVKGLSHATNVGNEYVRSSYCGVSQPKQIYLMGLSCPFNTLHNGFGGLWNHDFWLDCKSRYIHLKKVVCSSLISHCFFCKCSKKYICILKYDLLQIRLL